MLCLFKVMFESTFRVKSSLILYLFFMRAVVGKNKKDLNVRLQEWY